MSDAKIEIHLEFTPNPNTIKFVINRDLLEKGAVNFLNLEKAAKSPLAKKMFAVPGVAAVMIGTNFLTITKSLDGSWDVLAEQVPVAIEKHLEANEPILDADFPFAAPSTGNQTEIEKKIIEILDNDIRPAVAMDGGDITFDRYQDGVVYLHLQGSCSSCPSSVATLKMGVESRLKDAVPEIKEVVQV